MFKVVPDQLRVSDGWVRCGQCNEVFDANAHLQSAPSNALNSPAPQSPQNSAGRSAPAPAPAPVVEKDKLIAGDEVPVDEPFLVINPQALHIEHQDIAAPAATLRAQRANLGLGDASVRKPKTDAVSEPAPTEEVGEGQPQHSFMRKEQSPSAWSRPRMRAGLAITCLTLIGGFFLQVAVHERDRLAATEPSTRRFLESLCEALKCKIEPLRHIESIAIDSSSFTKQRSDVYRLSFALKNSSQTAVATPAVELTLTDMQDQPVVRRVFTAADFSKQTLVMEAGAELLATVPVSVKHGTDHEKIAGYRLLSFYP